MLYARGSFSGNYEPRGSVVEADCVIGNEFAYREAGFGSVNEQLAQVIADRYTYLPLFLNRNIAGALEVLQPDVAPDEVFSGDSGNFMGDEGEGTWGELLQAKQFMDERSLERPIIIAQAYHVGRVALQAKKLGIDAIIPDNLPRDFDRQSVQRWTRGSILWGIREVIGAPVLHHRGQL